MKATIFDIKHYAIHDGPGIRQTIFFKGCPLSCWWCHNPESRSSDIIELQKKENVGDQKVCVTETIGKRYSIDELLSFVKKDLVFFEESGGGVTLSGGEPLLQFEFVLELLRKCRKMDIHTCVDTTGNVSREKLEKVSGFTNLFLYDLKQVDNKKHKLYTGVDNDQILANLKLLDSMNKDVWIRYPLIPGMNDDESDLLRTMELLSGLVNKYPIYILPYHKIGSQKYEKFDIEYKMSDIQEPDKEHVDKVVSMFQNAGFEAYVGG